jgi:hypothetical protein
MEALDAAAGSHLDARLVSAFRSILPNIIAIKEYWDQQAYEIRET